MIWLSLGADVGIVHSPEGIDLEVAALLGLRQQLPQRSAFGYDQHAMIAAQVRTLRGRGLSATQPVLDGHSGDPHPDHAAAVFALGWLAGRQPEAPSRTWETILKATEEFHEHTQDPLDAPSGRDQTQTAGETHLGATDDG